MDDCTTTGPLVVGWGIFNFPLTLAGGFWTEKDGTVKDCNGCLMGVLTTGGDVGGDAGGLVVAAFEF